MKIKVSYFCLFIIAILLSVLISYPFSGEFVNQTLPHDITKAGLYLLLTACVIIFTIKLKITNLWKPTIFVAILMILTASLVYSFVRHYVVLLVLPSVFCFPGAVLGKLIVLIKQENNS